MNDALPLPNFETADANQIYQYLAGRMLFGTSRKMLSELQAMRPRVFNHVLNLFYGIEVRQLGTPADAPLHLKRYGFIDPNGFEGPACLAQARTEGEARELAVQVFRLESRLAQDQASFERRMPVETAANFLGTMGSYVYEPEAQHIFARMKSLQPKEYARALCALFDVYARPARQGLGIEKNRFLLAYKGNFALEPSFSSEDEGYEFGVKVLKLAEKYEQECTRRAAKTTDSPVVDEPSLEKEPSASELWARYEHSFCEPEVVSQLHLLCPQHPAVFNQLLAWHYEVVVYPLNALGSNELDGWFVSTLPDRFPDAPPILAAASEDEAYARGVKALGLVEKWNKDCARAEMCRGLGASLPSQGNAVDAHQLAGMIRDWWKDAQYMTMGERGDHNVFDIEPDFVTAAREILGSAKGFGDYDPATCLRT